MPYKRRAPVRPASGSKPRNTCVIYVRVSTDRQEKQGYSLDEQLECLRAFAVSRDWDVAQEYIEAESASKPGREVFGRMLREIKVSGVTNIVTTVIDRFARNHYDNLAVYEAKLDVYFVKEGRMIGPNSPASDRLIHEILLSMAKNFSDRLKESVNAGMSQKARQGIFPSCAPIGYLNVVEGSRKKIAIDPERAPLIKELFTAYASGLHSLTSLTAHAKTIGLRSRRGQHFPKSSIDRMLQNEAYIGMVAWGDVRVPGTHEAIVPKEIYDKVQARLHGRGGAYAGSDIQLTYRGFMECGDCGHTVTGHVKKRKYEYYHCSTAGCPGRKLTPGREITAQLMQVLDGMIVTPATLGYIQQALMEFARTQKDTVKEELSALTREETVARGRLERLYFDRVSGEVPSSLYPELKTRLEDHLDELGRRIGALKASERGSYDNGVRILTLSQSAAARFERADFQTKRAILAELQSHCSLRAGKLKIELNSPFAELLESNMVARAGRSSNIWGPVIEALYAA